MPDTTTDTGRPLGWRARTAIGLAQLLNDPGEKILADVRETAESPTPIELFPFLDGDIALLAAFTLDRLDDKHRMPPGPSAK